MQVIVQANRNKIAKIIKNKKRERKKIKRTNTKASRF